MAITETARINRQRLAQLAGREQGSYVARTARSRELLERAKASLPMGIASSFQNYDPYPTFMAEARGSRIRDADGNEYIDFDMAFGVLAAGHSHPAVVEAVRDRVGRGTIFTFPSEDTAIAAEEIKRRFGMDLVRFGNSGTEVTMDGIRIARGFTGRDKILKFEGGYHGHHDDVLVSIVPPAELMGPVDAPNTVPATAGIPRSRLQDTVVAPFNNADALEAILDRHQGEIAAIIIEPIQYNIGVVPPLPGFLERVRELATAHGAVLIFDEVKTGVVIAYGGGTERFGVVPDMVCLAKSIGGGLPVAAIAGREAVMRAIEGVATTTTLGTAEYVAHQGTYNGNPISIAATVATLTRVLTPDVYPELERRGNRLTEGCQAVLDEFRLPGYAINVGAKGAVLFSPKRVTNYRDFIGIDEELWTAFYFFLANRGILLPPGSDEQWTLSVAHTDEDVERHIEVFREFARELNG
ncbi:MAG TPA: aspartate aminotransferase family protein [Candidatus Limnocylindria bacterium]|nr:aspartate aminotransferase family protein [Candidatus Limnocylindria bacterium]